MCAYFDIFYIALKKNTHDFVLLLRLYVFHANIERRVFVHQMFANNIHCLLNSTNC